MPKIETSVVNSIISAIKASHDIKLVGEKIVQIMIKYLDSAGGILFLPDEEKKKMIAYCTSDTPIAKKVFRLLPKSFEDHKYAYKGNNVKTLIGKTGKYKKIFQSERFEDFISPEVPSKIANVIQTISGTKSCISLPVMYNEEVIGVLFMAFRTKELDNQTIEILKLFSNQAAIAINNAMKFEELQREHEKVQLLYEIEKETSALLSHELKTPIAIAYNNIQLFKNKLSEKNHEEPAIKELNTLQKNMERGVTRIDEICTAIFKLREIENHVPDINQRLDLQHSLGQVFAVYKERAKNKGLQFKSSIRVRVKDKMGPGVQFEQVLVTLLDNAIKYTSKGYVEVKVSLNQKTLKAVVSDSGPGIKEKDKDEIFKRFKRLKKNKANTEGLGLGLYIAKTILEQLGGTMKVEKNPKNRGSQFTICVPVQE